MSNLKQVIANFERAKSDLIEELENNTYKAGLHLEGAIKKLTPVKTWNLQSSIVTTAPDWVGTKIVVEVGTNLDYAPYVEFWIKSQKYNYHKWVRVFKAESVGAQMFQIANKDEQENITHIIKHWW